MPLAAASIPETWGWHLRFDDAAVLLWTEDVVPVAAGFLDSHVLRVTAAPGADLGALAANAEELLEPGDDRSDGLPMPGWELDQEEAWLVMSWTPQPVSSRADYRTPVRDEYAASLVAAMSRALRDAFSGRKGWRAWASEPSSTPVMWHFRRPAAFATL
jgi:hypothetical protein